MKTVLSVPINLLIFSEAHEYRGDIEIEDLWEEAVIYNYFNRKRENVLKRNIQTITPSTFLNICSDIAFSIIEKRNTVIEKKEISFEYVN